MICLVFLPIYKKDGIANLRSNAMFLSDKYCTSMHPHVKIIGMSFNCLSRREEIIFSIEKVPAQGRDFVLKRTLINNDTYRS